MVMLELASASAMRLSLSQMYFVVVGISHRPHKVLFVKQLRSYLQGD